MTDAAGQHAQRFDCVKGYVHEPNFIYNPPDKYEFGSREQRLKLADLLDLLPPEDSESPVVVDIGAGKGDFLAAIKRVRPSARAIGLTVLAHQDQVAEDIAWVYGDLLRPETWDPNGVLAPGTVDLSVSKITYHWLADPVRGLQINHSLIKPGGHLFVDYITPYLDPRTSREVTEVILQGLARSAGEYYDGWHHLSDYDSSGQMLRIRNIHLRGGEPLDFPGVRLNEAGLLERQS